MLKTLLEGEFCWISGFPKLTDGLIAESTFPKSETLAGVAVGKLGSREDNARLYFTGTFQAGSHNESYADHCDVDATRWGRQQYDVIALDGVGIKEIHMHEAAILKARQFRSLQA